MDICYISTALWHYSIRHQKFPFSGNALRSTCSIKAFKINFGTTSAFNRKYADCQDFEQVNFQDSSSFFSKISGNIHFSWSPGLSKYLPNCYCSRCNALYKLPNRNTRSIYSTHAHYKLSGCSLNSWSIPIIFPCHFCSFLLISFTFSKNIMIDMCLGLTSSIFSSTALLSLLPAIRRAHHRHFNFLPE